MDKAVAYINKISSMYNLGKDIQAQLLEHSDKINGVFEQYGWEDIEYAIDCYYTRKSDKNYPKTVHILAILNANTHDKRKKTLLDTRNDDRWYNLPSTKIKIISDAFLKVCRYGHKIGVMNIPYFELKENIKCGNDSYLKKISETDTRMWKIRWDWDDAVEVARQRFPDTFEKFSNLTKPELYTFAYKLGMITIGE